MTIKTILIAGKGIKELTNKFEEKIELLRLQGYDIIPETYRMSESMSQIQDAYDHNITLSILMGELE